MDWTNLVSGAEFLRKLFPMAPSLGGVRVLEIDLHQDGPRALIRFDLNEFPARPPTEWMRSHANKVQIRLMGIGVRNLEARGWSVDNIANIEISAAGSDGILFVADGVGFHFRGVFEHIAVESVSAYTDAAT